jgi:Protein of unknown function (DUF2752)
MSSVSSSAVISARRQIGENRHWQMLLVAFGVIFAAAMLEVLPEERVAVRGLPHYPLPHLCMSRLLYGATCPGCGLTRSFIHLAHGDWHAAWQVHRCGWLLAALVVAQIPYRALILARLLRPVGARIAQGLAFVIVGALILNWALSAFVAV